MIEDQNLNEVHLVGWSYGGMVVSGVLAKIPSRIAAITYLDAYLPAKGQSVASFVSVFERLLLSIAGLIGRGINPPDPFVWGIEDEIPRRQHKLRISPQPPRTFTQRIDSPESRSDHVSYHYIWCRGYAGSVFQQFYEKACNDDRFRVSVLESSHPAPITDPQSVARLLQGGSTDLVTTG